MRDAIDEIHARGADLVLIGNGSPAFAQAFREDLNLSCAILVDPELRTYRALQFARGRKELFSPTLLSNARRAKAAGFSQTSVQGDAFQLGGVLVVRRGGELAYLYRSAVAGDHPPIRAILEALERQGGSEDQGSGHKRIGPRMLSGMMDVLVAPAFGKPGFRMRQRTFDPEALDVDLVGKHCVVTGANSGIGLETALGLALLGASVTLVCRNRERGEKAHDEIASITDPDRVRLVCADLSDLASVAAAAEQLNDQTVDVLVHNAGMMADKREETPQGLERTFATHIVGPFLLTRLLKPAMPRGARLVWVSSGGMYTTALNVDDPNWRGRRFNGVDAYAETKRGQVVLAEMMAERFASDGIVVNAMHPGWADTPAVRTSLPRFHELTKGILRDPAEGADTVLWLAASEAAGSQTGQFFFDRVARRKHYLPFTKSSSSERDTLWSICETESKSFLPS